MKRFIAICTVLCLLLGAVPLSLSAEGIIKVSTAEDLLAIAAGDLSGSYVQTADINLKGLYYTPIGTLEAPFSGCYDGNGYTISGLDVGGENKEDQGLFGVNCGTIRNVVLASDCTVAGHRNVGGIAGRNCGVIEDCISDATVYHVPKSSETAKKYTLFSQNLCQWGDDALATKSSYTDSTTNSRRPGMIARIRNVDPDIMCFQEVSFSDRTISGKKISAWDTYLKQQLTDYTFVGDYRSNSDKEGVTVAFRTEQFTCLDSGMLWLSPTPDAPRAQQAQAWGANNVRTCSWVLLEDKETGDHLAVYSNHLDHKSALARENGGKVVAEKMEAIKKIYPDAIFMVAGDYNEEPGNPGYNASDEIFSGRMDDARYSASACLPDMEFGTFGDINSVNATTGTIDYIFIDSTVAEVNTFEVLTDYYNNLRPSDHHGLTIEFERLQNNNVGGITGINNGTVQRVLARGGAASSSAEAVGQAIGNNSGTAAGLYATAVNAIGTGKQTAYLLPAEPSLLIAASLNNQAGWGAFTVQDGEYLLIGDRNIKAPVCLTINGTDTALFAGDTYTAADLGVEDPTFILDGVLQPSNTITVPEGGGVLTVAPRTTGWTDNKSITHYTVQSMEDFLYLYNNKARFEGTVIHLFCDLDFSGVDFTSLAEPGFSFDGHGHTISNWGSKDAPVDEIGFFSVTVGTMGMDFIKNLNFENCHARETSDLSGMALVYGVSHPNTGLAGLPTTFCMENVHVRNCSIGAPQIEATGFLLSHYAVPGEYVDVYFTDCSVVGSTLDAENKDHKGLMLGKARSNAALMQARFFFEDCYVADNTMLNTTVFSGFILGSIESTSIDVYTDNVGAFNNTMNGNGDGSLICTMDQGGVVVERTVFGGNTINKNTKYLIAAHNRNPVNVTFTDVYSDAEGYTGVVEGKSVSHTPSAEGITSGAAGHALNALLKEPSFYWTMGEKGYLRGTADQQIRKLTVRNRSQVTHTYANQGTVITLEDDCYFLLEGENAPEGHRLTLLSDTVLCKLIPVSTVTEAVNTGDYSISSLEEWLYLEEHIERFRNRNVTVHLLCDIDLSGVEFGGFADPFFSFDGHGNTVCNWGTAQAPADARGLFSVTADLVGGLNYIKNLRMEHCHLTTEGKVTALVYAPQQGNAGLSGLPTTLTLENIHLEGCSTAATTEASALLLARYAPLSGDFTVNVTNCSVVGSTLDACNKDHKGLLVGKVRSNNTSGKGIFNLTDCYLADNTLLNASGMNAGLIFGTAENANVTANLQNIGVVNNTLNSTEAALIGFADNNSTVNAKQLFFGGNKVTADTTYLLTSDRTTIICTGSNLYADADLTAGSKYGGLSYNKATVDGKFTYTFNQLLSDPSFMWGIEQGVPVPVPHANRTGKLTVVNARGTVLETLYLNGGSTYTFENKGLSYQLADNSDGKLEGNTLTMPKNGAEATVIAREKAHEHEYGTPTANGDTAHKRGCLHCTTEVEENCLFTALQAEKFPALGTAFEATPYCVGGCGNTQAVRTFTMGDINGSGTVSVADAVCILRVAAGIMPQDTVYAALGNGDADNGITTADAVLLLQYFVQ